MLTARSDDGLRERLLQRAEFATQGVTARRLRKELTATTRPKDIWQHQQVQDFFRKIDVAIDNLDAVAGDVPAQVMLEVCGYGFDRIERALERVDDSAGARFDTIRKLKQLHEQSLASVDWSNAQVIAHLAHVLLDQSCFDAAEVLALANARCGEAGEEALFASAQQAFDKLPTLAGEHSFDSAEPYRALTALLTIRAQRLGDIDAEIAMNEKWRSDWTGVRDRAELVLRAGDAERAQALLNDANRLLGRACDARLQVEVHLALGQSQAAVAVLLEQFRDKPRLATYDLLIDAARAADIENATVAEVESMLWAGLREHGAWMRESYAMTLGQLLIRREEFVRCVDVARHHVNHPGLLSELGEMMTAAAPACAVELFGRGVEAHVASQSRAGYRAGVNLANRMYRSLAGRADTELATWRARFDARHYRKTGLVALMGQMDERRAKGD